MLGSRAYGYTSLKQCTSPQVSTRPIHDEPSVDSAALCQSPPEDEAFCFSTYIFLLFGQAYIFCPSVKGLLGRLGRVGDVPC